MIIKISRADAVADEVGHAHVQRYLRREDRAGIGVGVTSFGPLPADVDLESMWEAHDVPETHYVLSGHGRIREEAEEAELAAGDVVVTPPGRRHVLWADAAEPLVTVYVAVGGSPTAHRRSEDG